MLYLQASEALREHVATLILSFTDHVPAIVDPDAIGDHPDVDEMPRVRLNDARDDV